MIWYAARSRKMHIWWVKNILTCEASIEHFIPQGNRLRVQNTDKSVYLLIFVFSFFGPSILDHVDIVLILLPNIFQFILNKSEQQHKVHLVYLSSVPNDFHIQKNVYTNHSHNEYIVRCWTDCLMFEEHLKVIFI